jgi:hypothetical protein
MRQVTARLGDEELTPTGHGHDSKLAAEMTEQEPGSDRERLRSAAAEYGAAGRLMAST